ncbi:MAG: hypothetical protein AAF699_01560 [Pseudomonadota bacterium]
MRSSPSIALLSILLLIGLITYLFYPALFLDRSLVHGDNLNHGYAFFKFQHDVLFSGVSPFWTNLVYGGHPLFAESQAGLSNPILYLTAALFSPEFGHNFIHWLAMSAFGVACFGLCRTLQISTVSALFGALAATFSSLVIHTNTSMVAIQAMAWIPLTLWAFEAWLAKPNTNRAVVFGLSTSMLVFSGYPHFLHGTVIYMLVSMWSLLLGGSVKARAVSLVRSYWSSALLAITICVAISCIQWLPLLELASQSHRQGGVDIALDFDPAMIMRGLLYSTDNSNPLEAREVYYFPNVGSLMVCFLASLCFVLPTSRRLKGVIVATALLLSLGFGNASPVYRLVTEWSLIPGINSFRLMFPYFVFSIIGIAILAANSLDKLVEIKRFTLSELTARRAVLTMILIVGWCLLIFYYHSPHVPLENYAALALLLIVALFIGVINEIRLLPLAAIVVILVEILSVRAITFSTVPNSALKTKPALVSYIQSSEDSQLYRHYQLGFSALSFYDPYGTELRSRARVDLDRVISSTNLIWSIPSFSGALALKSSRKPIVNEIVLAELEGDSDDRPGARLIDLLSVKWINKNLRDSPNSRHLTPIRDQAGELLGLENPYARPVIQIWQSSEQVAGFEDALAALTGSNGETLFVESADVMLDAATLAPPVGSVDLKTLKASPTRYEFTSQSGSGFWLFLADTYYPGWRARIDDAPVAVYAAQVLGKALYVPPGQHKIEVYFQSDTLRIGMAVSGSAIAILLVFFLVRTFKRVRASAIAAG